MESSGRPKTIHELMIQEKRLSGGASDRWIQSVEENVKRIGENGEKQKKVERPELEAEAAGC